MGAQNLVGGAWLAEHYGVQLVMPLLVQSRVGGRRTTQVAQGITTQTYVESMRPTNNLRGHLTFHLKHEVLHLELLWRVFGKIKVQELLDWVADEPSGQYAKRAGFLYEWLTEQELAMKASMAGS